MEDLYEHCRGVLIRRSHGKASDQDYLSWLGFSWSQINVEYQLPIEELMLHVLMIIFSANQLPDVEEWHRGRISEILTGNNFEELIDDLGDEEKNVFLNDMKILEIIKK